MGKTALIYGTIAGIVIAISMTLGFLANETTGFTASEWFGYLLMLVALSFIFIGIKRYRDVVRGGVIGFWRATGLGLAITAIAGIFYVVNWEIYLSMTDYSFIDQYIAANMESARAGGASETELAEKAAEMEDVRTSYINPLYRVPITFMEIFPVGLIVSLISAAILRFSNILPARRADTV